MRQFLVRGIRYIQQLVVPPFCASCRSFLHERNVLCSVCVRRIRPVVSHTLSITATEFMPVLAIGAYQAPLISLILAKSSSHRAVSVQLGELMWSLSSVHSMAYDCVVPIPLHWTRYAWRGYNQAEEIARVVARNSEKPLCHLLERVKRTPYLSRCSSEERNALMRDVFSLNVEKSSYRDKHILLIDDVMTTGSTLKEAAKVLLKLRPASLTAAVVARTVR